jgi:hypothetical protein
MSLRAASVAIISLFSLATLVSAEIDSGGGKSSGGGIFTSCSIGGAFATAKTRGDVNFNHPGLIEVLYPVTPSSITDVNGNGLPDGWELQNFGKLGVDSAADADHDGTSNQLEYLAGTNPNNAASVFSPKGSYSAGIFQMPVPSVIGRNYQIWATQDLKKWTLQATLTGNGAAQLFLFDEMTIVSGPLYSPIHPSRYFFRVQIIIP